MNHGYRLLPGWEDASHIVFAMLLLCGASAGACAAAPQATRAQADAASALLASGSPELRPTFADVDYLPNLAYADDKDRLDVYLPEHVERAPVVVFFHGGGLLSGDKSHGRNLAARLLPFGIGVVSANYRLSPGVMHPAHIQDAAAATAWVIGNIERLGGDPANVFVTGHSAGAYLAALLVLDLRYLQANAIAPSAVRGAMPISPFLYVEETAKVRPKSVWGNDPEIWRQASVSPYVSASVPPMLLVYADGDDAWRREQNQRFASAMRAAGHRAVAVEEVANRDHLRLMTELNHGDDLLGPLLANFVQEHAETSDSAR
ncbi:MAG: alpha/beta hydrolase [Alphaproteobacteria bacterium]|nr:alpha/beta hydrolase [Alphaproteobacteria bacterium]